MLFLTQQHPSSCKQLGKNSSFPLRKISKLKPFLSKPELEMIISAFVSWFFDHFKYLLTGLTKKDLDQLQLVQNSTARLLTGEHEECHVTPTLASFYWIPINFSVTNSDHDV